MVFNVSYGASLLQAVSSYIQRPQTAVSVVAGAAVFACWGFPQTPGTAHKWSGCAFGSRTLIGSVYADIVCPTIPIIAKTVS